MYNSTKVNSGRTLLWIVLLIVSTGLTVERKKPISGNQTMRPRVILIITLNSTAMREELGLMLKIC